MKSPVSSGGEITQPPEGPRIHSFGDRKGGQKGGHSYLTTLSY
jgi:hypothetical protein